MAGIRISVAAGLLACTTAVSAQEQVPVEVDVSWQHPHVDIALPATLAGFTRIDLVRYDEDQYNLAATFTEAASGTTATVYIYRAGVPDVTIWADRAATGMLSSYRLGEVDLEATRFGAFTPPDGSGADSGFRIVAPLSGRANTATGLAILNHDGWLVKLRMTSRRLDIDALEARIGEFVDALPLGPAKTPAPAFAAIEDCPSRLKLKKAAKLMQLDMMGTILLGGALAAAHKERTDHQGKGIRWCRESLGDGFAVYRPDGAEKTYAIALGDAGITASVNAFDMAGLMQPSRGYLVRVSDGVTEEILPPFDRLPKPEQVVGIVGRVGAVTSFDVRPGSEGKQTINVRTE
jgi:hypothetical protein